MASQWQWKAWTRSPAGGEHRGEHLVQGDGSIAGYLARRLSPQDSWRLTTVLPGWAVTEYTLENEPDTEKARAWAIALVSLEASR